MDNSLFDSSAHRIHQAIRCPSAVHRRRAMNVTIDPKFRASIPSLADDELRVAYELGRNWAALEIDEGNYARSAESIAMVHTS